MPPKTFILFCELSVYSGNCFQVCSSCITSYHLPNQFLLCSETLDFFSVVATGINLTPVFIHLACIVFILHFEIKHVAKELKEGLILTYNSGSVGGCMK